MNSTIHRPAQPHSKRPWQVTAFIDSTWPLEEPAGGDFDQDDDHTPLELDDDFLEVLAPDDYEPQPEQGDFWPEQGAQ